MKYSHLLSSLNSAIEELGPINNIAPIQKSLIFINDLPELIYTDIFLSNAVAINLAHPFWQICNFKDKTEISEGAYHFKLFTEIKLPVKKLESYASSIGIVVWEENLLAQETLLYHLERQINNYAFLLVLNFTNSEVKAEMFKSKIAVKYIIIGKDNILEETLIALMDQHIGNDFKGKLAEQSYLNTIQPFVQLTREAIQQEQYNITLRKNLNGQLNSALRKEEVGSNINDIVTNIKTQLQYWNSDIEKAIKVKYEELNKPSTGRYSQHLTNWANELEDLDKKSVAEKTERLVTYINDDFLTDFEKKVSKEVTTDFANDYNFLLSNADTTLSNLNLLIEKRGINIKGSRSLFIDYSRFPDPEKTLRNYIGFTRSYSGELSKKGAAEYFAALREHTGSIMVAVGLLAPLNMIASAAGTEAGNDKTSFWAKIAETMRGIRADINLATALIIIGMIIWGYFDLRKRIPRKRIEEFERELSKAKELLQTEGKKMFNDASRDWQANISQWAREAYTQLQVQLEKTIRDFSSGQQQKLNDEKLRIQRLNQGLDISSKRIGNAEKIVDGLFRSHKDALTELEKSLR